MSCSGKGKNQMILLNLYSTLHCHLCEDAEMVIKTIAQQYCIELTIVEIADNNILLNAYGNKIPVLHRLDTETEINWPFDAVDLKYFLGDIKPFTTR
jgi:hypothetical protein